MFVPDHLVESVQNPTDRKLVLKDPDTGAIVEVSLPVPGREITWFDQKMYDCWGREIVFDPKIKRLLRDCGVGGYSFLHYLAPVFLAELTDGNFAFVSPTYHLARGYPWATWSEYDPKSYPLTDSEIAGARLTYDPKRVYSSVNTEFFTGTPLGNHLKSLGHEVWLAYSSNGKAYAVENPYAQDVRHCIFYGDTYSRAAYSGGTCALINPHFEDDGRTLIAQMPAWHGKEFPEKDWNPHRLLTVALDESGIQTDNQDSLSFKFRLLRDDADPYHRAL